MFTLLIPDFTLILIGFLMMRLTNWGSDFWVGLEKIVYYILFPALLFYSTARTPFDLHTTGNLLQVALIAVVAGIALGWLAKPLFPAGPMMFESGVQTAFRFNSFIALALASRLGGDEGTTLMAIIIGFSVPINNFAAVHALARKGGKVFKELLKNPLLISTASGTLFNVLGLHLPQVVGESLARMGNASIAVGLIAVGAGLRLSGLHQAKGLAAYFLTVKLMLLPAIAFGLGRWMELPPLQFQIVVAFAALPSASSTYVLATRMGGNGPFVAFLISMSTLLSAVTMPFWLSLAN